MDQLSLSFHEEFLLQLKTTDWEFESRPGILEKISSDNKFVQLDRGTSDKMTIKPDKNGSSENNK